jgi:hypothetical protein
MCFMGSLECGQKRDSTGPGRQPAPRRCRSCGFPQFQSGRAGGKASRKQKTKEGIMFQVRIHGRGGQGVVTAAEMLSIAAFEEGRHAQAFPSFGSERTGAPVVAFCRIADKEIRLREPIMEPDALIIQDPTLLHQVDVFAGLKKDGYILINTTKTFEQLGLGDFVRDWHPSACAPWRPPT